MARRKRPEQKLYHHIRNWLEEKGYFTRSTYTDSKGNIPDYTDIGIKGVGGESTLSELKILVLNMSII